MFLEKCLIITSTVVVVTNPTRMFRRWLFAEDLVNSDRLTNVVGFSGSLLKMKNFKNEKNTAIH